MKKNVGTIDKAVRVIAAVAVAALYHTGTISGTAAVVLGAVAAIFLFTSIISFCPLYAILGVSTCKCCGGCKMKNPDTDQEK